MSHTCHVRYVYAWRYDGRHVHILTIVIWGGGSWLYGCRIAAAARVRPPEAAGGGGGGREASLIVQSKCRTMVARTGPATRSRQTWVSRTEGQSGRVSCRAPCSAAPATEAAAVAGGDHSGSSERLPPVPVTGGSVVHVGRQLLSSIPSELLEAAHIKASKFVVVSDHNVWGHYGAQLMEAFYRAGYRAASLDPADPAAAAATAAQAAAPLVAAMQVEPGEGSKSRATKAAVEDFMISLRCNRDTCLVAFGGGVVGDLVGFVAATYMRGVPVVQIATSTTAMIDSSVGGKTAINVPAGKNLIGAFHQPTLVYADMDLLASLPRRELVEGIAEAIKMGCIRDPALFALLERRAEAVLALERATTARVIYGE
jgi:hypothetical protein